MPETRSKTGGEKKPFDQFVREAPTLADLTGQRTVTLTGMVARSEKEGMFVLATPDGQTVELNVDAVRDYKEMEQTGGQRMVQLEIVASRLPGNLGIQTVPTIDQILTIKEINVDTIKEAGTDPIIDVTLKETPKDPIGDTFKEAPKDPIYETLKEPVQDTFKEVVGDPNTWVEAIGTAAENIGQQLPGGGVINPAAGANVGAAPFIMATPHHAPTAPAMMQLVARGLKAPAQDVSAKLPQIDQQLTIKEINIDTLKEAGKDPLTDTFKELIGDTFKELINDTYKEMVADTWVEGIGTAVEGIGQQPGGGVVNPPVWNLPGLMF